ncbi:MAG: tripartite tricarboxylate transporter permease [Synergistaceae bacterium]|jgi:putative tricarboxylic transport membrane protein|nr:tripartite tricarboxylate transporter permease [Synergistaceae bacterium]
MDSFVRALASVDAHFVFLVFIGSFAGLVVGALPGLSATMATALLVSITYSWNFNDAMALILGVYVSGVYGGCVSAVLINIPGAPSSVATTFDGFPMALKGEAAEALWTATFHSFTGTLFGFLALAVAAKPVTMIALRFMPMDYFLLAVFGMLSVGGLTSKNLTKGCISGALGVLLAMVGTEQVMGMNRYTFDTLNLQAGISLIPALIGLFGFTEVLDQISQGNMKATATSCGRMRRDFKGQMKHMGLSLRASVIGTIVGAIPGTGGPIAALLAYNHAVATVRNPKRPFGEGTPEGIVASESANNACIGGALIPLLTLAIPGDAVTAVILAAFYVHGLHPGPLLFTTTPDLFPIILIGGLIASVIMLLLGMFVVPSFSRIVLVPKKFLLPIVSVFCVIGTYAAGNSVFEVYMMFVFGLIGFLMRSRGYPVAPMVLGLVLGGMMDTNFRRAMNLAAAGDNFLTSLFVHPTTLVLTALVVVTILLNIPPVGRFVRRKLNV